jgi:exonuclease SbcD
VESVSADVFDGFDYVALGHLHGAQIVTERIRYCGSPLPYAFSEAGQRKSVYLVDLDAAGAVSAQRVELPVIRELVTLRGPLADILEGEDHCGATDLTTAYLSVELTDPVRPLEPMRRLRERFSHTLVTQWVPATGAGSSGTHRRTTAGQPDDGQLLTDFVRDARGSDPGPGEQVLLHRALVADRLVERVR